MEKKLWGKQISFRKKSMSEMTFCPKKLMSEVNWKIKWWEGEPWKIGLLGMTSGLNCHVCHDHHHQCIESKFNKCQILSTYIVFESPCPFVPLSFFYLKFYSNCASKKSPMPISSVPTQFNHISDLRSYILIYLWYLDIFQISYILVFTWSRFQFSVGHHFP